MTAHAELIQVQRKIEELRNERRALHGPEGVERIRKLVRPLGDDRPEDPDLVRDRELCQAVCDFLRREAELKKIISQDDSQ